MIQLPHEMRVTLIEQLDGYLDSLVGSPEAETVAEEVVEIIETVAEEMKVDDADEIIVKLETSGELDANLHEVLEAEFDREEEFDFSASDIVRMLEKVCDIEWSSRDEADDEDDDDDDEDEDEDEDEDDPDGFFDDLGGVEDDED